MHQKIKSLFFIVNPRRWINPMVQVFAAGIAADNFDVDDPYNNIQSAQTPHSKVFIAYINYIESGAYSL